MSTPLFVNYEPTLFDGTGHLQYEMAQGDRDLRNASLIGQAKAKQQEMLSARFSKQKDFEYKGRRAWVEPLMQKAAEARAAAMDLVQANVTAGPELEEHLRTINYAENLFENNQRGTADERLYEAEKKLAERPTLDQEIFYGFRTDPRGRASTMFDKESGRFLTFGEGLKLGDSAFVGQYFDYTMPGMTSSEYKDVVAKEAKGLGSTSVSEGDVQLEEDSQKLLNRVGTEGNNTAQLLAYVDRKAQDAREKDFPVWLGMFNSSDEGRALMKKKKSEGGLADDETGEVTEADVMNYIFSPDEKTGMSWAKNRIMQMAAPYSESMSKLYQSVHGGSSGSASRAPVVSAGGRLIAFAQHIVTPGMPNADLEGGQGREGESAKRMLVPATYTKTDGKQETFLGEADVLTQKVNTSEAETWGLAIGTMRKDGPGKDPVPTASSVRKGQLIMIPGGNVIEGSVVGGGLLTGTPDTLLAGPMPVRVPGAPGDLALTTEMRDNGEVRVNNIGVFAAGRDMRLSGNMEMAKKIMVYVIDYDRIDEALHPTVIEKIKSGEMKRPPMRKVSLFDVLFGEGLIKIGSDLIDEFNALYPEANLQKNNDIDDLDGPGQLPDEEYERSAGSLDPHANSGWDSYDGWSMGGVGIAATPAILGDLYERGGMSELKHLGPEYSAFMTFRDGKWVPAPPPEASPNAASPIAKNYRAAFGR